MANQKHTGRNDKRASTLNTFQEEESIVSVFPTTISSYFSLFQIHGHPHRNYCLVATDQELPSKANYTARKKVEKERQRGQKKDTAEMRE